MTPEQKAEHVDKLRAVMDRRAWNMAEAIYGVGTSTVAQEPKTLTADDIRHMQAALEAIAPRREMGAPEALQLLRLMAAETLRLANENVKLREEMIKQ